MKKLSKETRNSIDPLDLNKANQLEPINSWLDWWPLDEVVIKGDNHDPKKLVEVLKSSWLMLMINWLILQKIRDIQTIVTEWTDKTLNRTVDRLWQTIDWWVSTQQILSQSFILWRRLFCSRSHEAIDNKLYFHAYTLVSILCFLLPLEFCCKRLVLFLDNL